MANNSNTDSRLVWVKAMERGQCFPLDATEIWYSLEDAQTYAQEDPTAYVGQKICVIKVDDTGACKGVIPYYIGVDGNLVNLSPWVGTAAEYKEASDNGEIAIGTIVYIIDDENKADPTSAVLGEAILGQMVLG